MSSKQMYFMIIAIIVLLCMPSMAESFTRYSEITQTVMDSGKKVKDTIRIRERVKGVADKTVQPVVKLVVDGGVANRIITGFNLN